MTACVRDLALTYPGRFEVHIAGAHPDLWQNNPHITKAWGTRPPSGMPLILLSCRDALRESDSEKLHYLTAYHRDLSAHLDLPVPVLLPKGDLHLSDSEKHTVLAKKPYWLIIAGGKKDIPLKVWSAARFQELVSRLKDAGIHCVQAGATLPGHFHPELKDVIDLRGKTDLRGFLQLIYHSDGVICPVSFPMHAAAALGKPCVVLAGGREPFWWESYTNEPIQQFGAGCSAVGVPHIYLHSIGQLSCCRTTGCWNTHLADGSEKDTKPCCQFPVIVSNGQQIPQCLSNISVDKVVSTVLSINRN